MDEVLRCSFCHKSQETVGRLISSPSDYPRAYICDECIAVCNSVMEDDGRESGEPDLRETGRFIDSPLTAEFLTAAENWAVRDLAGFNAVNELNHMRVLASMMLAEEPSTAAQEESPET